MAKEIVLDAVNGSSTLCALIDDMNEWCPCGPGARRGLNRIFGRATGMFIDVNDVESAFIKEMVSLLREAQREMPKWCNKMDLTLHDIQFQLCEFDKYERIRNNERGWVARYVPMEKREAPKRLSLLNSAQVESILRESKYYEYFPATNSLKRQRTGISHGHTAGNSPVLSQRK